MKKIYIILTHTGTLLSRGIRILMKHQYTHVSISLDKSLIEMYSFGRLHPYNAFFGGFVQESRVSGTFKRFTKTTTKVLMIEVTDSQYQHLKNLIEHFKRTRKNYKFNTFGLFSVAFNYQRTKKNEFYCAEFIKYLLDQSKIKTNLPTIVTPEDFQNLHNSTPIYIGYLKNYRIGDL